MELTKIIGLATICVALSVNAQAADAKYNDVMLHGSAHHSHSDGDWHGVKPHKHNGIWTHRGHSHTQPVAKVATPAAPIAAPVVTSSCGFGTWRNNYDLQVCRVKQAGSYNYSYDFK